MADSPSSPANIEQNSKQPESDNPFIQPDQSSTSVPPQEQQSATLNPNSNQVSLPPPIQSYVPPQQVSVPPTAPSYRPVTMPAVPQFSPVQNFQNTAVQPPGVGVSGSVAVTMAPPMMPYHVVPGQLPNPALRPYAPVPNGYGVVHAPALGLPRYPAPYPAMVRPVFPPRPPGPIGVIPAVARPPVPGIPGVRPIITPVIRPAGFPVGTPAEKPETTVYVGKIASTADNDFMLSLLQVCGPVKSWKRPQHPSNGTLKGFGFCEFESAEGVLRALRLLSKFNVDGQELMLNVTQATKDYLERYVEKKTENTKKLKETHEDGAEKEDASVQGVEKKESPKASEDLKDSETGDKENHDYSNFGIVTDEDREMDQEGSKKLKSMIEERLKANPLPPPPSQSAVDDSGVSHSEVPAKNRDGDSDVDILRNDVAADKIEDETASDSKATSEHERPETSSPDRRTYDRRSRDRDRERDLKREKEREIDRYEREAERERVRKEREQRRKIEDAEREYERCLKDWEYREREKEKERQYEKERAKERERKRKKEILYDEEDEDDDSRKRWRRSVLEDKKRKRLREKEDDFMDKIKEEEEIAEAKKRAEEEQLQQHQRDALKLLSGHEVNGTKKPALAEEYGVETKYITAVEQDYVGDSINEKHLAGDEVLQNGTGEESMNASVSALDMRQSSNTLARKLGFGLVGSGKRAAVPSVFHEEEDDDAQKEKKMRPLVPIDYSTEELQAAQPIVSGANQPNLAAAAEFAKHISNVNSKEEKLDSERERSRRSHDRSGQREKDRSGEDNWRTRDENKGKIFDRDRDREHGLDKVKTPDNKKLLDAKQLIDMIPKTKEELFSHEINWAVYDEHELHERMRPWISKKITEFLGEEETTLVDYIVSSTQEHVKASQMLELLQTILDDEAEMFVLKMWRMLIFEIKKVETGLAVRSRS